MELPIELFLGGMGISIALAIFGFLRQPQIPAMLCFGGMFMLVFAVATDTIIMDFFTSESEVIAINSYNVLSRTGQDDVRTLNSEIQAEFVSASNSMLVGDEVNCMTLFIKKSGTPDLNTIVRFGVWDNSATPILKYTFGTMNVTEVPTVVQPMKMCNMTTTYEIVTFDRIGISWNDGDAVNRITLDVDTTNPFDGVITFNTRFNGVSWVSNTGTDYQGVLSLETGQDALTTTEVPYEFTELPKTLFALMGSIFMLCGALMVLRNN